MASLYTHLQFAYQLQIRYEPFFLDCDPDQETAKLPNVFNKHHGNEIATSVLLCDPIGNMFQVVVDVQNGEAYFVKGWNEVVKFYGILAGGWARFIYLRPDRLMFKMRDRLDQEVVYPSPPKITWIGETPKYLASPPGDHITNHLLTICQKPDLYHVLEKTLTFADVYSGRLHIPNNFCQIAFRTTGIRVKLYDDYCTEVSCFLQFRSDSPATCGVSDGWYRFCLLKRLAPGMRIHLRVPSSNPTMLSFAIVKA